MRYLLTACCGLRLISIMLGRLRMSLRDAKCAYTTMSRDIFDRERYHRGLKGAVPHVTASWEPTGLENSIKTSVADTVEKLVDGDVRSPDQRLNAIAPEHRELFTYMPSPSDLCRVSADPIYLHSGFVRRACY